LYHDFREINATQYDRLYIRFTVQQNQFQPYEELLVNLSSEE